MAKELPYFKFEPGAWDNGNIQMVDRELKGLFIDLCSLYWSRLGDVPLKLASLKLCGGNATALESLCDEGIIVIEDGLICIDFLELQLSEFKDLSETNQKNARDGWEKRRKAKKESDRKATAFNSQSETDAIREEEIRGDKSKEDISPKPPEGDEVCSKKNIEVEKEKTETKKTPRRGKFEPDLSKLDGPSHELVQSFIEFRKRKRRSFTCQEEVDLFIETLREYSEGSFKVAKEIVENSIRAGYPDIYRPKNFTNGKPKQSTEDHARTVVNIAANAIAGAEKARLEREERERRIRESSPGY